MNSLTIESGTWYTDNLGRVWIGRVAWDKTRTAYLVGVTKDTPTFTLKELKGIQIDGLRRKEGMQRQALLGTTTNTKNGKAPHA